MVSLNGFINVHRKETESSWYKDIKVKAVFLHIRIMANFTETSFDGKKIMPGQHVFSYEGLGKEIGLSRQEVRTALGKLKKWGEITTESTNQYTIATIVNWDKYQSSYYYATNKLTNSATIEQPTANQQPTIEQPHRNNDNKVIMEERKKDSQTAPSFSSSIPVPIPRSVEEVQQYCERMGYKIDAARFFYYYSGHGWKTGNEPIMDWHALVKYWNETQKEPFDPVQEQPTRVDQETKADRLSHELWSVYSDLLEDGEIEYNPIPPTSLEEVLEYCAGYSGHSQYAEEFYLYFKDKGWKVSEWIIRDWKLAFQTWAQLKEQNLNDQEIVIRMRQNRFSSLDSMFFCTEEERNKIKEKIDWRVRAAR